MLKKIGDFGFQWTKLTIFFRPASFIVLHDTSTNK